MAIRAAIARACAVGGPDVDLGEHGRALAVGDDLRRQLLADPAEREREGGVDAGVRPIPLAPLASRQTASFVEHSPSTEIELKLRDGRPEVVDRLAGPSG